MWLSSRDLHVTITHPPITCLIIRLMPSSWNPLLVAEIKIKVKYTHIKYFKFNAFTFLSIIENEKHYTTLGNVPNMAPVYPYPSQQP